MINCLFKLIAALNSFACDYSGLLLNMSICSMNCFGHINKYVFTSIFNKNIYTLCTIS